MIVAPSRLERHDTWLHSILPEVRVRLVPHNPFPTDDFRLLAGFRRGVEALRQGDDGVQGECQWCRLSAEIQHEVGMTKLIRQFMMVEGCVIERLDGNYSQGIGSVLPSGEIGTAAFAMLELIPPSTEHLSTGRETVLHRVIIPKRVTERSDPQTEPVTIREPLLTDLITTIDPTRRAEDSQQRASCGIHRRMAMIAHREFAPARERAVKREHQILSHGSRSADEVQEFLK